LGVALMRIRRRRDITSGLRGGVVSRGTGESDWKCHWAARTIRRGGEENLFG